MPRLARAVCARVPHHITQRGNRREDVFFAHADRMAYRGWSRENAEQCAVDILAYCLMTKHIHLVAVPATEDGLQQTLKPLPCATPDRSQSHAGLDRPSLAGTVFLRGAR
jgi:putative transposase